MSGTEVYVQKRENVTYLAALNRDKRLLLLVALIAGVGLVGLAFGPGFILVRASTANVTGQWVIPTDKSMSISYPTGNSAVSFQPALSTFAQEKANLQTDATGAYKVTNTGNTAYKVTGQFSGTPPAGVSEWLQANSSTSNAPPTTLLQWVCTATVDTGQAPAGHCNVASNWTTATMGVWTSLAAGANFVKWCWSWGTAVTAGTNTATLVLTST